MPRSPEHSSESRPARDRGGSIRVGTSGWSYDHWDGEFYPDTVTQAKRLAYYVTQFPTVEINASFYRLPTESMLRGWRDAAPNHFRYAVKGSRLITHYHRIGDVADEVAAFMERTGALKAYRDVVLWQLPPTLERDDDLLERFLRMAPRTGVRHAVEFRHTSWLAEGVFGILRAHRAACVHVSSSEMPRDFTVTADFVYVRLHGLEGYGHDYSRGQLRPWAKFLREQSDAGRDGYVYFNNDARACAPKNARMLVDMLGDAAFRWPRR